MHELCILTLLLGCADSTAHPDCGKEGLEFDIDGLDHLLCDLPSRSSSSAAFHRCGVYVRERQAAAPPPPEPFSHAGNSTIHSSIGLRSTVNPSRIYGRRMLPRPATRSIIQQSQIHVEVAVRSPLYLLLPASLVSAHAPQLFPSQGALSSSQRE